MEGVKKSFAETIRIAKGDPRIPRSQAPWLRTCYDIRDWLKEAAIIMSAVILFIAGILAFTFAILGIIVLVIGKLGPAIGIAALLVLGTIVTSSYHIYKKYSENKIDHQYYLEHKHLFKTPLQTIWADFNAITEDGLVRLGTIGSKEDLERFGVRVGDSVILQMEDDVREEATIILRNGELLGKLKGDCL